MPPLPVVPQVCKLAIEGTYHDTAWVNIWYVHYTGTAPSESNLTAYLAAISSAVQTNYEAQMSVDNEVTGFKITDPTAVVDITKFVQAPTSGFNQSFQYQMRNTSSTACYVDHQAFIEVVR